MKKLFLYIAILFFPFIAISQQCAFDNKRQELLQDPGYIELERAAELKIKQVLENQGAVQSRSGESNVLTIPIVVHVLHLGETIGTGSNISVAQIQSSIDNLNDFYRGQTANSPIDFEIEFALAQRDPDCNATTGINRIDASSLPGYLDYGVNVLNSNGASYSDIQSLISWPQTDYFNVWIVTELDGNNGGFGFQGYAYFYNEASTNHGCVMMSTVFGYDPGNTNGWGLNSNGDNSTVVHEVGHFFHLYHTFQGDDTNNDGVSDTCPADVTVGTDSDGCADTVPHKRETSTCPTNNSCTGNPWVDNNTINNIMSYYNCTDLMTNDQKTRVRAAMESTAIVNSKGASAPDSGYAAPNNTVCATNVTSTNVSGIVSVELNGNSFTSYSSFSDGGNIDKSESCSNYFEINTENTNTLNVGVFTVNFQQLGVWIDWNDDGDFDDDAEQQYLAQDLAANSVIPITLTYPTTIPYDDYVRIRLITELDDRYGVSLINSACYTSLVYGQSEDYAIYVKPAPVTYTYNGSWSPADPVGISTDIDDVVIQSGDVTLSSDVNCKTLSVNAGSSLTVDLGTTVCATTVNLNSSSQQYASLILNGTIEGTVNYNRHTAQIGPVGSNDLISAPLTGQTFGNFDTNNANLAASGSLRAFAPYNTTAGAYQNYDTGSNANTVISSGTGYRAATTDGSPLTFTGIAPSSDILNAPISDAAAGNAWNLIGNPFPSYLDFNAFFQQNKSQLDTDSAFQAIYGYDGDASNGWVVWNQATIDEGSVTELIAPGQGFFIKSKSGGGMVDFTTSMRRTGASDDFISGRTTNANSAFCQLYVSSDSDISSTQLYFIDGTSRGLDVGYDAAAFRGNAGSFSIFSNLVEDNSDLDMAIQTLPYSDLDGVVVPLGINALAATQLTIGIDDITSTPQQTNIYLEDKELNTFTLLNTNDYVITPSEDLLGVGRFYIHFTSQVLSASEVSLSNLVVYSNMDTKQIIINGQLSYSTDAYLYDMQGRLIKSQMLDITTTTNSIDTSSLNSGIYIIKISNSSQTKAKKVIVK